MDCSVENKNGWRINTRAYLNSRNHQRAPRGRTERHLNPDYQSAQCTLPFWHSWLTTIISLRIRVSTVSFRILWNDDVQFSRKISLKITHRRKEKRNDSTSMMFDALFASHPPHQYQNMMLLCCVCFASNFQQPTSSKQHSQLSRTTRSQPFTVCSSSSKPSERTRRWFFFSFFLCCFCSRLTFYLHSSRGCVRKSV